MNAEPLVIHFPFAGLDVSGPFSKQPARHVGPSKSDYARTCCSGHNVRGVQTDNRSRGGSRCGISRLINEQVSGTFIIQELAVLVTVNEAAVS